MPYRLLADLNTLQGQQFLKVWQTQRKARVELFGGANDVIEEPVALLLNRSQGRHYPSQLALTGDKLGYG